MATKQTKKTTVTYYYGTGRRKSSIARVYLAPGTGKISINGKDAKEYLPYETDVIILKEPFNVTNNLDKFDAKVFVKGGGFKGQTDAIKLGIARALLKVTEEYRSSLKTAGLLRVDSRVKERKNYGLKGARRAPQFSKR